MQPSGVVSTYKLPRPAFDGLRQVSMHKEFQMSRTILSTAEISAIV